MLRGDEDGLAALGCRVGAEPTPTEATEELDIPVGETQVAETPSGAATEDDSTGADEELLDDEILGIFVEEAEEVLETIHEYYPQLRQHHDDHAALTEVRRAYHTLKGSGRLVGAADVGEFAWVVENLLNRVLEGICPVTRGILEFVREATERLPALVDALSAREPGRARISDARLVADPGASACHLLSIVNTSVKLARRGPASSAC